MMKITPRKALPLALGIAAALSFGSPLLAHDLSKAGKDISTMEKQQHVSRENARNLVKSLLKRDYSGNGYKARVARKTDGKWIVRIKDRTKTVATASVDAKTGNIHVR